MSDSVLKEQLIKHLKGGEAFKPLEDFIDDIPFEKLGERPNHLPYSFYELFYHITFAQKDILEFCTLSDYKASQWPDSYWPKNNAPNTKGDWDKLKQNYFKDRDKLENLISESESDLSLTVKNSDTHSLFREILLVIEHSAYHTGQMLIVLRLLGLYKK